jgi:hypothetical protein
VLTQATPCTSGSRRHGTTAHTPSAHGLPLCIQCSLLTDTDGVVLWVWQAQQLFAVSCPRLTHSARTTLPLQDRIVHSSLFPLPLPSFHANGVEHTQCTPSPLHIHISALFSLFSRTALHGVYMLRCEHAAGLRPPSDPRGQSTVHGLGMASRADGPVSLHRSNTAHALPLRPCTLLTAATAHTQRAHSHPIMMHSSYCGHGSHIAHALPITSMHSSHCAACSL